MAAMIDTSGVSTVTKSGSETGHKEPTAPVSSAERIHALAHKALEKIEELGLNPIPQIYELWFRYFQGDPEITRAIDNHPGEMDEVACYKLYKRYLSETSRGDAIKKIGDQVQQSLTELAGTLSVVKATTTDYGGTLADVKKEIENAKTIEELGRVVSGIVEETKLMAQKNQDLEFQLTSSSTQVAELKKNLDNVKKEATTDGLTGLANRKAFDKQIQDWVEEAGISGIDLCLLMMDIDHFKHFNDTYGHQTGDQVLRLVARTLLDGVKGGDFAARFGGEEFALIFPNTPLSAAVRVADTLRKAVEGKEVVNKNSNESLGRITLSGGLAHYTKGESVSSFIERADAALYDAKKAGRNTIKSAT
jgi:diguanylate cyclase